MLRSCKHKYLRALSASALLLFAFAAPAGASEESTASRMFRQTVNAVIAVPSYVIDKSLHTILHGSTGWHREKFFELLEASGYELKKANTTAGLIPEIRLVYEQGRALSENDREALEEEIREFEEEDPTWIEGKIEARILRFLLAASEVSDYRIGEFEIDILPLPGFAFSTMPGEFSYTPDTVLIMRRMNEMRDEANHDASPKGK